MEAQVNPTTQALYDQDYHLWLTTTIEQLRQGKFSFVDWENLLEELEGMNRSDKRAIISLLTEFFEHLLKLAYWETEREYNKGQWKREIRNFRRQIKSILKESPSLKPFMKEDFLLCYQSAREDMIDLTNLPPETFPIDPIATLEEALNENWFFNS